MSLRTLLLGKPIPTRQAEAETLGVLEAVPVLGLDALSSAAYGPEAALTVFLLAGSSGLAHIGPLTAVIIGVLLVVQFSYRQTIAAYPNGGGSFTVAKENLGTPAGLWAASALFLDYVLNVAVAISAGVGALVSMFPRLLPHTLPVCLVLLLLLLLINLRGVRAAGLAFMAPTFLYVGCLGTAVLIGLIKSLSSGGHPVPLEPLPPLKTATEAASTWVVLRAFASGCTAMTGVEAVSNAVPIFHQPRVRRAQRTLSVIMATLVLLLAGIAVLCPEYRIGATPPGEAGYQSVLSQLLAATTGRGVFYYVSMGAVVAVLCLSANTSFADFPRLCRLLALDEFLPLGFAHQGRRLVYSQGIVLLALLASALLVLFRGITDRLIPLFAVGAFSAFTLSQMGMVAHWRRRQGRRLSRSQLINGAGALATLGTLVVISAAKFTEGAWVSMLLMTANVVLFARTRRYYRRIDRELTTGEPLEAKLDPPPVVVVPIRRMDRLARKGLRLALSLSPEVYAVQVRTQSGEFDDLSSRWPEMVERPLRERGLPTPRLVTLASEFRELADPLLDYVHRLAEEHPGRYIAVLVPELIERRWYHYVLQSHTATLLKMKLLYQGGPRIVLIDTPWHRRD